MPLLLWLQMLLEESPPCPAPVQPADSPCGKLSSALSSTLGQLLAVLESATPYLFILGKKPIISLIDN